MSSPATGLWPSPRDAARAATGRDAAPASRPQAISPVHTRASAAGPGRARLHRQLANHEQARRVARAIDRQGGG